MLALASATDPGWATSALASLDEILIDHAHCEKKAASTAVSLLFRYPEHAAILAPLARLAREELLHFEQVLSVLAARGLTLRRQVPSPYAGELMSAIRAGQPGRAVDTLLCHALIEARSCERMTLLAAALDEEPDLAQLYRSLLASEARHHHAYVDLAERIAAPADVRTRLAELALHEAAVITGAPRVARLHAAA